MLKYCFPLFFLSQGYAQGEVGAPPDYSSYQTLVVIAVGVLFMYFILWRPEQKRRKELEAQRSRLKKGDKVTAIGIIGTVDTIKEETIVLRMIDGNKIEFLKAAVSEVVPDGEVAPKSE